MFRNWSEFTPQKAEAELPRLFESARVGVAAAETSDASWESLVYSLNDALSPLYDTWSKISHLCSVMNTKDWRLLKEKWQPDIITFATSVAQSEKLYTLRCELEKNISSDSVRSRIVRRQLLAAKLSGVSLTGSDRERFNEICRETARLSMEFNNAVIDATSIFKLEKGGKTYSIDDAEYPETMKHCADREVREALYRARNTRATENFERIVSLLKLRREQATLLGFDNYASLSLADKCAPTCLAVESMIDMLDEATLQRARQESEELDPESSLSPWDIAYEQERLRERLYDYSESELKKCFELEVVLAGLWRVVKSLFGVDVVEVPKGLFDAWHQDVRFFNILNCGKTVANFYFDPYVRSGLKQGGAWMNEFENLNTRKNIFPLCTIVTNFPLPDENGKCFLPLRDVETLFHEFGHALQCCLTTVKEEDAAGIKLVEWDAVEVSSQFLENWVLNPVSGYDIPGDLKRKVRSSKNFRAASFCRRQLAFAKLDWLLHSVDCEFTEEKLRSLQNKVFAHFGLPSLPEDAFLCAFCHIFAGGYAAGYYGYKWAEVMSLDAYGAFEDRGESGYAELGRKFRDTFLSLGGSMSAYEVFRLFMGREPKIDAMLRLQGLK